MIQIKGNSNNKHGKATVLEKIINSIVFIGDIFNYKRFHFSWHIGTQLSPPLQIYIRALTL